MRTIITFRRFYLAEWDKKFVKFGEELIIGAHTEKQAETICKKFNEILEKLERGEKLK